jgi:hypothetical protein
MADRQVARLKAALADREARVQILEARVAALEASTSLRVGRAVTDAARKPGKGVVARERPMFSARDEDRLIAGSPLGVLDKAVIVAGVLGPDATRSLGRTAHVVPLMPHDAALLLDTADVDLVIVDAAAGAPGGPWAYLGVPGVPDRERALHGLLDVARGRGRPAVLLGTSPGLAGLGWDATLKDGTPPVEALAGLCARLGIDQP